ncbi:hypothetical protein QJS66_21810 [Kocuria rhizophila]|nr:hypothetical protein QJS66_21810 [Kocuria rhizophila]
MSLTPVTVAIAGAARPVGYSLLFQDRARDLLAVNTPSTCGYAVHQRCPWRARSSSCGCASACSRTWGDRLSRKVFDGAQLALLVGRPPAVQGRERGDLPGGRRRDLPPSRARP